MGEWGWALGFGGVGGDVRGVGRPGGPAGPRPSERGGHGFSFLSLPFSFS